MLPFLSPTLKLFIFSLQSPLIIISGKLQCELSIQVIILQVRALEPNWSKVPKVRVMGKKLELRTFLVLCPYYYTTNL